MAATTDLTAGGNGLLGCWLIVAPVVFQVPAIGRWNDVLVGATVVLLAGYNYVGAGRRPASTTAAGIVAVLGCWLVVAPFALGLAGPALWSDVFSGTVIAGFGGHDAYVGAESRREPFA
ncbi:hypothetical protein C477_13990 [Haloterrigena salina JCM 13891]|uniref:SPW repeat-containing integral membrane domain-containing protein n=1 Tax=Haloterrigena salina JCM 13891 TaxID=1227488 RepID=M0C4V2_9EURY|nr:hypothetical protein [Haloterrigena salina]ELZ17347.1 hypothetical protein C477_13990 [Haloterrigena salina JCM 13891]